MKYLLSLLIALPLLAQAEDFSFNIDNYKKENFEWDAEFVFTAQHQQLDSSAAFYQLNFDSIHQPASINRLIGELELGGLYRFTDTSIHFQGKVEASDDELESEHESVVQEFYLATQFSQALRYEIGKRTLKWGKGYAWNPVAFAENRKDPNDPDLNREGFILVAADYIKTFSDSSLKTLSISPLIIPVSEDINDDFGKTEDTNFGLKVYLLHNDTDFDFYLLNGDSRGDRIGFDFSTNINPELEWHGELAYLSDQTITRINDSNQLVQNQLDYLQSLIGIRYLTDSEITWIVEYFYNEGGYSQTELDRFYTLANADPVTQTALYNIAVSAQATGFGKPNPGKNYLYLRASKKDFFDIIYVTAAFSSIINTDDNSYSLIPEIIYTGVNDLEIRGRLFWLGGDNHTEFGEKSSDNKLELRLSYSF